MHPEDTLLSGQVFLWRSAGRLWYGVNGNKILRVGPGGKVHCNSGPAPDFFRDSDNPDTVRAVLGRDPVMAGVMRQYPDLRITKQDFFQCLISFIVSANSNIPRIRRNLESICRKFGSTIAYDGMTFHTFPEPRTLARADTQDIAACGTGYRSAYVRDASRRILDVDVDVLGSMPYDDARRELCLMPGVGNKVADCVLLFSLGFLEAIPLDRWVARMVYAMYGMGDGLPPRTDRAYTALHDDIVGRLGRYAGYAQQYMFKAARDSAAKPLKW